MSEASAARDALDALHAPGCFGDLDVAFAELMLRTAGTSSPELALAAALASRRVGEGHVCVGLAEIAGRALDDDTGIRAPALAAWTQALRATPVVGAPGERRPLVLDAAGRLYLWRYWDYERRLAAALLARAAGAPPHVDRARLAHDLVGVFAGAGDAADGQRVAAATAVLRRLCVISGGPGTGKTHTVAAVLRLLASQASAHRELLRVGLAAPTGKAAARMQEALRSASGADAWQSPEASTLHRLLGFRPDSVAFRHHAGNPLPLDVVIVDEASMVDLALMAKLVDAMPPHARLVLLGDRDQLSSVEAGAVLGDVCGPATGCSPAFAVELAAVTGVAVGGVTAPSTASPLQDVVVLLRHSFRFDAASDIGRLAAAVRDGDAAAASSLLHAARGKDGALAWVDVGAGGTLRALVADFVRTELRGYAAAVARGDVVGAFGELRARRILCAHRSGPASVEVVGRQVEEALSTHGLLQPGPGWYAGRPVMVVRNDYAQRLFNGDVGVAIPDAGGGLRVWFETPDGGLRAVAPGRLPAHETVWAMTVHKSQGSEFDAVVVVLPPEPSPVTTRELVYTAVTRARRHVSVWGTEAVFAHAVRERVQRSSGLREALWAGATG